MTDAIPPSDEAPDHIDALRPRRYPRLQSLAVFLGLALILAAVALVWWERDTVLAALHAIGSPDPLCLLLLALAVVANVALTALMFNVLMSRYGRVGILEMQAVIASATLLNFLPLRPGLFGRIAYHKAVNKILALHSARAVVEASALSLLIVAFLAANLALSALVRVSPWYGVILPPLLLPLLLTIPSCRVYAAAALIRYLEVIVWAVRYYAAFQLIGRPVPIAVAFAFACISMIATMLPFVSNGLGLREWAVGLAAPLLTPYQLELGITAELVNRAAEIIVVVILGLLGVAWLAHRRKHYAPTSPPDAHASPPLP